MKIAYLDTIAGISGDMTLGAFISAGVPFDHLRAEIGKLALRGVELEARHIQRNGITAVKLDVGISVTQHHHRHLKDILAMIDASTLSARVKSDARSIFMEVAKAEAKVHNSTVEKIHFHEVGALDSIVDIVGAAICLETMGIESVYTSPIKLGSGGFVTAEHGRLPVPGPAAMEILQGYPVVLTDIPFELTTPTGAAIVKAKSSGVLAGETIVPFSTGYGAGTREMPQAPNLLRVVIGEMALPDVQETLVMLETNIDDMNPEITPYVMERLFAAGANDVFVTPVVMKKGRTGILLSVLVGPHIMERALQVLYSETTTTGVRVQPVVRRKLERTHVEVRTQFGVVKAKKIALNGVEKITPEFEECKRIAAEQNIPLQEVYRRIERELFGM